MVDTPAVTDRPIWFVAAQNHPGGAATGRCYQEVRTNNKNGLSQKKEGTEKRGIFSGRKIVDTNQINSLTCTINAHPNNRTQINFIYFVFNNASYKKIKPTNIGKSPLKIAADYILFFRWNCYDSIVLQYSYVCASAISLSFFLCLVTAKESVRVVISRQFIGHRFTRTVGVNITRHIITLLKHIVTQLIERGGRDHMALTINLPGNGCVLRTDIIVTAITGG